MKKIILGLSLFLLGITILISYSPKVFATFDYFRLGRHNAYGNRMFNPGNELSKSKCGPVSGNPVINVVHKVQNDADSGEAGNYWAFDYYRRTIKVWPTGENTYCAVVTYDGKFYAVPGQVGPGNEPAGAKIDTAMDEPVNGNMSGGYRATITGSMLSPSLWPKTGVVPTQNYKCDLTANCPGRVSWTDQYFNSGYVFGYDWWGWQYRSMGHGTWVNSIDGNTGNIL